MPHIDSFHLISGEHLFLTHCYSVRKIKDNQGFFLFEHPLLLFIRGFTLVIHLLTLRIHKRFYTEVCDRTEATVKLIS